MEGTLIEGDLPRAEEPKPPRTHWDMLLGAVPSKNSKSYLRKRASGSFGHVGAADREPPAPGRAMSGRARAWSERENPRCPSGSADQRLTNVGPAHLGHTELALGKGIGTSVTSRPLLTVRQE